MPKEKLKKNQPLIQLKAELDELLESNPYGRYTHNIISLILRQIGGCYGYEEANKTIEEFDLTNEYSIYPESLNEEKALRETLLSELKKTRDYAQITSDGIEVGKFSLNIDKNFVYVNKVTNFATPIKQWELTSPKSIQQAITYFEKTIKQHHTW